MVFDKITFLLIATPAWWDFFCGWGYVFCGSLEKEKTCLFNHIEEAHFYLPKMMQKRPFYVAIRPSVIRRLIAWPFRIMTLF